MTSWEILAGVHCLTPQGQHIRNAFATFGFSLCRKRMKFLNLRISSTSLSYKAECDMAGVCVVFFFCFSSSFLCFLNFVFSPSSSPAPQLAQSLWWWQILLVLLVLTVVVPQAMRSMKQSTNSWLFQVAAIVRLRMHLPASFHFTLSNLKPVICIAKALNGIRLLALQLEGR